jgi:hypothetical protein
MKELHMPNLEEQLDFFTKQWPYSSEFKGEAKTHEQFESKKTRSDEIIELERSKTNYEKNDGFHNNLH